MDTNQASSSKKSLWPILFVGCLALGLVLIVVLVAGFLLIPQFVGSQTPTAVPAEPAPAPTSPVTVPAAPTSPGEELVPQTDAPIDASTPPADLVRAMTAYVDDCFGTPGKIALSQIVVHGDEAAAIATIVGVPEIEGERALVLMRREGGRWLSVNYGSGLDAPDWYPHW